MSEIDRVNHRYSVELDRQKDSMFFFFGIFRVSMTDVVHRKSFSLSTTTTSLMVSGRALSPEIHKIVILLLEILT